MENTIENTKLIEDTSLIKTRESGIELFRIISMLLIIAHHYVVNSGVLLMANTSPTSINSLFLYLFGGWGKTGINCFVLITGYFMCKSNISTKKFFKLLLEIEFYRIIIYAIFIISGYAQLTLSGFVRAVLPITSVAQNFIGCYLLFFLLIPFLNVVVKNISERQHVFLILVLLLIYTIIGSIPKFTVNMNYVSWFIVLYFIASYVRIYPKKIFDSKMFWGILSLILLMVSAMSILVLTYLGNKLGMDLKFYFVFDSNKILALVTAFSAFMYFKNHKFKSKFINGVASTTFGVLLIHANSDLMRQWLWGDVCKVVDAYGSNFMILHAIISVVIIFIICTIIDYLRVKFIEKPIMKKFDAVFSKVDDFIKGSNKKGEQI